MEQLFKCFENKHYPNLKEYVSKYGNIHRSGYLVQYCLPGVDLEHWKEISFQEFAGTASPEALVLIDFINHHKRLPNWILPQWIKLDFTCR